MSSGPLVRRRAAAAVKRAAATRWREASVRELTIKLRSILIIAAVGAPSRSTLRESESGALGENLFELATLNVFSHSSSEFHSRFSRRAAQGIPERGRLAVRPFLPLPSFGCAKEGNQLRGCPPEKDIKIACGVRETPPPCLRTHPDTKRKCGTSRRGSAQVPIRGCSSASWRTLRSCH